MTDLPRLGLRVLPLLPKEKVQPSVFIATDPSALGFEAGTGWDSLRLHKLLKKAGSVENVKFLWMFERFALSELDLSRLLKMLVSYYAHTRRDVTFTYYTVENVKIVNGNTHHYRMMGEPTAVPIGFDSNGLHLGIQLITREYFHGRYDVAPEVLRRELYKDLLGVGFAHPQVTGEVVRDFSSREPFWFNTRQKLGWATVIEPQGETGYFVRRTEPLVD